MAKPTFATCGFGRTSGGPSSYSVEFGQTSDGLHFQFLVLDAGGSILSTITFAATIAVMTNYAIKVSFVLNTGDGSYRVTPTVDGTTGLDASSGLAYVDVAAPFSFEVGSAARFGSLYVASAINNQFTNVKIGTALGASDVFDGFSPASFIPPFSACIKDGVSVSPVSPDFTMESGSFIVHPSGSHTAYTQKNF